LAELHQLVRQLRAAGLSQEDSHQIIARMEPIYAAMFAIDGETECNALPPTIQAVAIRL